MPVVVTACWRFKQPIPNHSTVKRVGNQVKASGSRSATNNLSLRSPRVVNLCPGWRWSGRLTIDSRHRNTTWSGINPEYGPKANQLLVTNAGNEGRDDILKRFAFNSYGTRTPVTTVLLWLRVQVQVQVRSLPERFRQILALKARLQQRRIHSFHRHVSGSSG